MPAPGLWRKVSRWPLFISTIQLLSMSMRSCSAVSCSLALCSKPSSQAFLSSSSLTLCRKWRINSLGVFRREQRLRIAGDVRHVERGDIDVDAQKRRLTQAETVERQRTTIDLRLLREVDALAVLAVRHPKAKRYEHTYQHQQQTALHTCFLT